MTQLELENILRGMYNSAPSGESSTMIHLFGIMYADELKHPDLSIDEIANNATKRDSYGAEVRKGMRLLRYVELKPETGTFVNSLVAKGGA